MMIGMERMTVMSQWMLVATSEWREVGRFEHASGRGGGTGVTHG